MTPGWYPDPTGRYEHRYYNGSTWTADVSVDGQHRVDALGVAPSPVPLVEPTPPEPSNGLATAALVTGCVGAALGLVFLFPLSLPLGILAVVFGAIGLRRSRTTGRGRPQAITGLITGPLALVLSVVAIVVLWDELVEAFDDARIAARAATEYEISLDPVARDGRTFLCGGTLTNERTREREFLVRVEFLPSGSSEPLAVEQAAVLVPGDGDRRFVVDATLGSSISDVRCAVESVRVLD